MSQSNSPILFTDRALGKTVPAALQVAGAKVRTHDDLFRQGATDIEWLKAVSQQGWVALTKDQNIGRNQLEVQAIAQSGAKVFVLVAGNLSRQQMVDIFVDALHRIEKFTQGNQAPFIAKVYRNAEIKLWRNRTQLLKLLRI